MRNGFLCTEVWQILQHDYNVIAVIITLFTAIIISFTMVIIYWANSYCMYAVIIYIMYAIATVVLFHYRASIEQDSVWHLD